MPAYKAPLRDIKFVVKELLQCEAHYQSLNGCEEVSLELIDAILDSGSKFAENVIAPLNRSGDEQGCVFENGQVRTPDGFKSAFEQYAQGGWQGLSVPLEEGGQGLPGSCGMLLAEMTGSANYAWSMIGGLAQAPISLLLAAGTDQQKNRYMPKLLSGEWAGTMCLTEAHCGSDVGLLRTRAKRNDDGSYAITGTKIFISGGEQDITDNIVHTVLARIEGAPEGTRGVSLFIVPKKIIGEDGLTGEPNALSCGAIEKKMGLKASPTCVMNFDGAEGYLLGEENGGLAIMFNILNTARLGTGTTGIQSLDLLGRKVMGSGGKLLANYTKLIHKFCLANEGDDAMREFTVPLQAAIAQWAELTTDVGTRAMEDADEIGSASVDYTLFGGYIAVAFQWAKMALIARQKIDALTDDDVSFYQAKWSTARFYFARILPRAGAHASAAAAGADTVMALAEDQFIA
ncbi:UNVERIFIED_CONTAM: hypothetical protein GTU68_034959 [Idotea baltica]|nr:hypothetical protein [Idotea baltica]